MTGWFLFRLLILGSGIIVGFVRSEGDCSSERARGQFSIFGAIEEKEACGFLEP
jgi:hypothetical protein